jgi:DNA-binding NarL/FixJ family response regulator
MADRIRVLLADDHLVVAAGLRALLEREFDIVATVHSGYALVATARHLQPDVIVADITLPDISGIEAARMIRKDLPAMKIVLLTMHANALFVQEALNAGSSAYVLKRDAPDVLISAIRGALRGKIYTPPSLTRALTHDRRRVGGPMLTARQRQILQLICQGHSLKEIAWDLHIAQKTVEFHKYKLMRQLNARNTADMVAIAVGNRLIAS